MNSGYLGSFIIHGVLIAMGLSAASLAMPEANPEPPDSGPVIDLEPGLQSGGDGAPGGPTAATPRTPVAWTPVKVIKADELLQQWIRNQPPSTPANPVSTPSTQPVKPTKPSPRPTRPAPQVPGPGATPPGMRPTLVAPTVDGGGPGPGPGVGPGGSGVSTKTGGPGPGSGNTAGFAASVRTEFAGTFVPLFREQGADIASDKDSGEVKLRVSPAGNVTFSGWVTRPSEPLLEKIVLRSIEAMHPVPPPPGGVETLVSIKFTGSVE